MGRETVVRASVLAVLLAAAIPLLAAEPSVVAPKPGTVEKNDKIDRSDEEEMAADHIQVIKGGQVTLLVKTFLPPKNTAFVLFPQSSTHVDIWANPDGLGFDRLVDTNHKIKIRGAFSTDHAGNFPLRAEGNITSTATGPGGGPGGPSEGLHWSAMVDHLKVGLKWSKALGDNEDDGGGKGPAAFVTACFSKDNKSVTCVSTKDLSNVVAEFTGGAEQKFDGLRGCEATFSGTGENLDKTITGVWIKCGPDAGGAGAPRAGERSGLGEHIPNPAFLEPDDPRAVLPGQMHPKNAARQHRLDTWGDVRLGLLDPNKVVDGKLYFGGAMELRGTLKPFPLAEPVKKGDLDFKRTKNELVVLLVPGHKPKELVRDIENAFPKANEAVADADKDLAPDPDGGIYVFGAPAYLFPAAESRAGCRVAVRASFIEWVEFQGAVVSDKLEWHMERTVEFDGQKWVPVGPRNEIRPGRIKDFEVD